MIPKINRVLYTTDLSGNSPYVFRYAVNTAEKHDAEIIILHVVEEVPSSILAYSPALDRILRNQKEGVVNELNHRLDEFCESELRERPECMKRIKRTKVVEGYPAEVILRVADEEKCDIIIMGTHGKGIISQTFLGSVAERVLRRTRKPVFVIPLPPDK
jgi:nucleotide-binding universal stress UspA family protein